MIEKPDSDPARPKLSRRAFRKGTGLVVAATSASSVLSSCAPDTRQRAVPTTFQKLDDKKIPVPTQPTQWPRSPTWPVMPSEASTAAIPVRS